MVRFLADMFNGGREDVFSFRDSAIEIITVVEFGFGMQMILRKKVLATFQEVGGSVSSGRLAIETIHEPNILPLP